MAALSVATLLWTASAGLAAFGHQGTLGTVGAGEGQFYKARGLAAGADGNLYVADGGNHRVQVVDTSGTFVRAWGSYGSADGQFQGLFDVAVGGSGHVYTLDSAFGGVGGNDQVKKFTADGGHVWTAGNSVGGWNSAWGVAADASDNLYVADWGNSRVVKLDPTDGHVVKVWGVPGFGAGQFTSLTGITVDGSGDVYTLEAGVGNNDAAFRVQKFDGEGNLQADFLDGGGNPSSSFPLGSGIAQNAHIPGIDVDASGFVYVGGASYLLRFTPTGAQAERLLDCPTNIQGVGTHANGRVYAGGVGTVLVFGEGGGSCNPPPGAPPPDGSGGPPPGGGQDPVTGLGFSGSESVTINEGAAFTNESAVELSIRHPGGATTIFLSNDGGFLAPEAASISQSGRYPWRLAETGQERLPKTVYVRFGGPGGTSAITFSDDIILDQTDPTVEQATLTGASSASVRAAARRRRFVIRVRARDNASGVRRVQFAVSRRRPGRARAFARRLVLRQASAPRFVRVRDGAGNYSRWRRITRR